MRIVIQRVKSSRVLVNNEIISSIDHGMNILVCLEKGDTIEEVKKASEKVLSYRIFADDQGRMNKNIIQVEGEILAVSQFTLSWNGKKGNRPSFDNSMEPEAANDLFNKFCDLIQEFVPVKKGAFGENMQVEIINDGPVTFCFDF